MTRTNAEVFCSAMEKNVMMLNGNDVAFQVDGGDDDERLSSDIEVASNNGDIGTEDGIASIAEHRPLADGRIKKKAKRPSQYMFREGASNGAPTPTTNLNRVLKNSRKSRNGFGRGLPKKGNNNTSFFFFFFFHRKFHLTSMSFLLDFHAVI